MNIGVIGATGYVGGRLVPALLARGHNVRCLARTPSRLDRVWWRTDVKVAQADVLVPTSLESAFSGLDVVYYLVHAMGHAYDFERTDRVGADNTKLAAEYAGVGRIVYLGGLGDDDSAVLSRHLASRHKVGRILASGPIPVTELRAAVIIGSGSASFEMLRHLVEVLPMMICPRWVTRTRCQPIAITDVLHHLVAVLDEPEAPGGIVEIGGPEVLTYREMMQRYAAVAGLPRRLIIPVPVLTPRLSSHWVNLVTPLPIGLARPLVDSLINDVVVTPAPADTNESSSTSDTNGSTIPTASGTTVTETSRTHRPISFDDAVSSALSHVRDLNVSTSWTDSASPVDTAASPMPQDPAWAGGTILADTREALAHASSEAVFTTVAGIGGERGWYFADSLWAARGWIDELLGGVGMRRGRRHPDQLRVGDALDFFRVEVYEPPKVLRLRAEMKLPGKAWLEWRITSNNDGTTTLRQLARFHPHGIAGRLYWWSLLLPHTVLWNQLIKRLARIAEQNEPTATEP
ncbi:MAG: SDR family oxidoreductase [Acidimicrobiaceae bacterium]|nr:SDR family oxidoreductase [Acidimicrobiaceae bacterium]